MGKSIQWRPRNDKEPQSYGETVRYGGRRHGGRAYLAHSDRVGPGVLVIGESGRALADPLVADGFTVLVPELSGENLPARMTAAADFLRDNWHPRVGVVGVGAGTALAADLAARIPLDALVLSEELDVQARCPVEIVSDGSVEDMCDFFHHHLA
jgi:hypothetical protein